jgi:hypothetical protein
MNEVVTRRASAPALPSSVNDLLAQRKTLRTRTLNDDVDEIHLKLWDKPEYRNYFVAIWREDTREGSFIADDIMAATMIRDFAADAKLPLAANSKLAAIVRSLHVVTRRYGISRKERQSLVDGEVVAGNGDTDE